MPNPLFATYPRFHAAANRPKSVVANKGYKRYLKAEKGAFAVDLDKARDEQRFDGMWVLRTNTELTAVEVALRYKQLWMVEQLLRTAKSLLDTRPIFHKTDATICGHVFCWVCPRN